MIFIFKSQSNTMSVCYVSDVFTGSQFVYNHDTLEVCRICLAKDVKMKNLPGDNLDKCYRQVTGLTVKHNDQLPKMLCWECVGRLKTANLLRNKALKSYRLLSKIASRNKGISMEDVNIIDREENELKSTLVQTQCDINIFEEVLKTEPIKVESTQEVNVSFEEKFDVKRDHYDRDENKFEETSNNLQEYFDNLNYEFKIDRESSDNDRLRDSIPGDEGNDSKEVAKEDKILSQNVDVVTESNLKFKPNNTSTKKINLKKVNLKEKKEQTTKIILSKKSKVTENESRTIGTCKLELSRDFTITPVTFEEQKAEIEKRQESAAYRNKRYKCTVCYSGFSSKVIYDTHCAKHSEKAGSSECFVCKKRFKKPGCLKRHISNNHTESYSCKNCKFVTNSGVLAKQHLKCHTVRVYACSQCPEKFKISTTYLSHLRIKHSSRFVCNLCGYTFISQKGVEMHKHFKHDDSTEALKGPFCDKCDVRFASEDAYKKHLTMSSLHVQEGDHNDGTNERHGLSTTTTKRSSTVKRSPRDKNGPVTCELCGLVVAGYRAYNKHFQSSHPGQNRTQYCRMIKCICEHCGKSFPCKSLVLEHMNVHTKKESYKCEGCERRFFDKAKLRIHQRVHKNIRYPCPYCAYQFTMQTNCKRHILTVHKCVKNFHCDTCGKAVTTSKALQDHIAFVHNKLPRPKRERRRPRVRQPAPPPRSEDSDS